MNSGVQLLVDGLVFGEGPRWRGDRLWFSDMHAEAVLTVDRSGRPPAGAERRRFGDCDRICAYFLGYRAGDDLIAEFVEAVRAAS